MAAYEATYTDTTGIITDKLTAGLTELYGSADVFFCYGIGIANSLELSEKAGILHLCAETGSLSDSHYGHPAKSVSLRSEKACQG